MTETRRACLYDEQFTIEPCENGSYIIYQHADSRLAGRRWAFSSLTDLLAFLTMQAKGGVLSEPRRVAGQDIGGAT